MSSVEGTKNIFAKKGAERGAEDSILVTGLKIASQAKALQQPDLGQLRNSIEMKFQGKDHGFNGKVQSQTGEENFPVGDEYAPDDHRIDLNDGKLKGIVGTNSDHWYPEFGTRYQAAQPFLRPAKSIVVDGAGAVAIGKKYGREAMEKEFQKRKVKRFKRG